MPVGRRKWWLRGWLAGLFLMACALRPVGAQVLAPVGEWWAYGADAANTKYSPLDQVTPTNFRDLEIAWRWTSISTDVTRQRQDLRVNQLRATPLMVDGLVYVSTALGQVAALGAGTGALAWSYDPRSYERIDPSETVGWQHRGVSYWHDTGSDDARVFIATRDLRLIALHARTGALYPSFGDHGIVDLSTTLGRPIDRSRIRHSSPVAVVRDTVVVGSSVTDRTRTREAPPGHVRGYDARTGAMKWIFHTIPQGDEYGVDSWQNGSWRFSGHTNVWGNMAADEELGYVYLPISTPTNDWYGGMRPGDNLFAESIVCVDVETGQRVWHFQAVHHGLWDYDFPTAGNLLDITVDGRDIRAIAQTSKQAFTYVFDRATGEPVWPIEERPVPAGDVPGEWYSPTQPFPTKPPPFDLQGITIDDLIDFVDATSSRRTVVTSIAKVPCGRPGLRTRRQQAMARGAITLAVVIHTPEVTPCRELSCPSLCCPPLSSWVRSASTPCLPRPAPPTVTCPSSVAPPIPRTCSRFPTLPG